MLVQELGEGLAHLLRVLRQAARGDHLLGALAYRGPKVPVVVVDQAADLPRREAQLARVAAEALGEPVELVEAVGQRRRTERQKREQVRLYAQLGELMRGCGKPVVLRVRGYCIGPATR